MKYYTYDGVVYRGNKDGRLTRWNGNVWKPAKGPVRVASHEEYRRLREVSEAEADRRRAAY